MKKLLIGVAALVSLLLLFFGYSDRSVDDLKEKYAGYPSSFVEIDGMKVHYRDEGSKSDSLLPIVLIHGTGSSLHTFDAWTNELKFQRRIVRMDLPAFGLTGPFPDRNYSIDQYVDFMQHFLVARGIKKCILGGNSLGGNIAWQFTAKYPHMVDKLILIDAAGYPMVSKSAPIAFRIARIPILNNLLTFVTPRFMARASVENVYADKSKVSDELVDRYFELTLRKGNRRALVDRMQVPLDSTAFPKIKSIQQPTLILWGGQDMLIPVDVARRFQNDLPNDTLVIMENVGHVPMEESPKESLRIVQVFLEK
ncbi:alpha/beta fold hydrolase [Arundinibacter roseus]|uniref:Alpha/beta hydrolase n=1 Tax=Arundinibacter roseus TaxID=2070510 RepID=A0A4R4JWV3_9BACT|nr:alpha/beta hydrolase [Arundinibacter roseus]TDB59133.1 alpha/beta hydrolase [Arundinibacter roseus]